MAGQPVYVPVLKGKEGEYGALEALSASAIDVRDRIMPLVEVPDVPYDYETEESAKTLDQHVDGIGERLRRCWHNRELFIELPWSEGEERLSDGRVALESVLSDCADRGVAAVPVLTRKKSGGYLSAAKKYLASAGLGLCIRLLVGDFEEDIDLESEIGRMLRGLSSADMSSVDLLLDLEDLGPDTGRALLVARSLFSMVPSKDMWRRVILLAASFPADLSEVDAAAITTLPRREWDLWKTLQRRKGLLPRRDLIFGDYGIAHPVIRELDPRKMRMSASIRYTTPDSWLILKGRNVRQYGFDQYFELSKALVKRPEYCGRDFSWGDQYIDDCSEGMTGPGNATTWRKVGTNHHLTMVVQQLANLSRVV